MKNIKIKDVIENLKGEIVFGKENDEIIDVSTDTRTIKEGDTFIALKGENNNGNEYLEKAFEKGAKIAIVDEICIGENEIGKYKKDRTLIKVKNGRKALIELARYKRSLYDIPVVAITGSVGKTSTKDAIAGVLSKKYKVLKTEGNFNNNVGLPLTILKLKDHDVLVVEMGMNHFGEISELTKIARPTISVISNIGTSHIGILGSRENILKAKLEILEGMKKGDTFIINGDNDLLRKWYIENKKESKFNIKTFGISKKNDYMGLDIKHGEENSRFKINLDGKEYDIVTAKPGEPFVMNSLSALAVGDVLGVKIQDAQKALESGKMSQNRMDIEKLDNGITVIKDYYNASYESIKPGLEYLMTLSGGRKIAVLGDIRELGDFAKELHEKVGKEVVKQHIDILVTVGEDAKNIAAKAIESGMKRDNVYVCDHNNEAANILRNISKKGDKILIKASHAMKFEEIYEKLKAKIKVAIIAGGMSTEHDVSLKSSTSILKNINKKKYDTKTIYFSKSGDAYEYIGDYKNLCKLNKEDLKKEINIMEAVKDCDIVFPVLHGAFGEDGCIQGVFEIMQKPYVGPGVLSSSICMDKVFTKEIINKAEIAQAKYIWLKKVSGIYVYVDEKRNEKELSLSKICKLAESKLNYPMFIKPSNAGSSIGITRVTNIEELEKGIEYASKYDKKIIIEEGVEGREVECAVLGNDEVIASRVGEVLAADTFYSYDAKYDNKESKTVIPAKISKSIENEIRETAVKAFKAVDGKGLSRIDFFIEKKTNRVILNEINTLPGFTNISMYPKLFEAYGIGYSELIDKLLEIAKVNNFGLRM